MQPLNRIDGQNRGNILPIRREKDFLEKKLPIRGIYGTAQYPTPPSSEVHRFDSAMPHEKAEFFFGMSASARRDFESLATPVQCFSAKLLIVEEQKPCNILFLLEGEVNISMTSLNGKQFLLGVARAGEILGLASAISGDPSEIRAVARHPCKIAFLRREDFLDFLLRYPPASRYIALELSLHCRRISERLRILGLTTSVRARLASLLLEWCREGRHTEQRTHIPFFLTHGEIADCIGSSRESITRTLTDFKNQDLVRVQGSTLIVPNRPALAIYAGIDPRSNRQEPSH
jgi:CRP/FNR family cyclic AMP-dependent transcriptional regulator